MAWLRVNAPATETSNRATNAASHLTKEQIAELNITRTIPAKNKTLQQRNILIDFHNKVRKMPWLDIYDSAGQFVQTQRQHLIVKSDQLKLLQGIGHRLKKLTSNLTIKFCRVGNRDQAVLVQKVLLPPVAFANSQAEKFAIKVLKKVLYCLQEAKSDLRRDMQNQLFRSGAKNRNSAFYF